MSAKPHKKKIGKNRNMKQKFKIENRAMINFKTDSFLNN